MGKKKTNPKPKPKKKNIGHADGSGDPNHPKIIRHVKAILSGVPLLKTHFPQYVLPSHCPWMPAERVFREIPSLRPYYTHARGLGTLVSPFMNLKELLEAMIEDVCAYIPKNTLTDPDFFFQ